MNQYYEWDSFQNVYLEDSFVLSIEETKRQLSIIVEVVLTEKHALYEPPDNGKQYCYKQAKLVFQNLKSIKWIDPSMRPIVAADGSVDYGNIDSLELVSDGYHMVGDWGEVLVNSSPPKLEIAC